MWLMMSWSLFPFEWHRRTNRSYGLDCRNPSLFADSFEKVQKCLQSLISGSFNFTCRHNTLNNEGKKHYSVFLSAGRRVLVTVIPVRQRLEKREQLEIYECLFGE